MNKLVCSYTQTEDKRTAIDIAILKGDLEKSGGHARWVVGNNMVADALTKRMRGDFLELFVTRVNGLLLTMETSCSDLILKFCWHLQ